MKNFKDFKDSVWGDRLNQICISEFNKAVEAAETLDFEDCVEKTAWIEDRSTIGYMFAILEEYHNWLNK